MHPAKIGNNAGCIQCGGRMHPAELIKYWCEGGCIQAHPAQAVGGPSGRSVGAPRAVEGAPTWNGGCIHCASTYGGWVLPRQACISLWTGHETLDTSRWDKADQVAASAFLDFFLQLYFLDGLMFTGHSFCGVAGTCGRHGPIVPGVALATPQVVGQQYSLQATHKSWKEGKRQKSTPLRAIHEHIELPNSSQQLPKITNDAVHALWGSHGAMSQVQTYRAGKRALAAPKGKNFPARAMRGKKV
ncbi:hypothetical protein DFH06DRAFT_1133176 [Mycena polygramma]|nr:hypothetical protein DFH06DRAFT_1133176 [Mycena polygramma]